MRRETQNVLLVLLGGALLKISFTGGYLRYVRPQHQWLLILGGTVMLALAAVAIVREVRGQRVAGHDHPARSAWLLLLPVLAVFLIAPPALGSDSVQRAASAPAVTAEDGMERYPALPKADVVPLGLSEFTERAAWDSGGSLTGRAVRLTGFVVHEGRDTYVARIAIACCAADAYPVKVKLLGTGLSRFADDRWVEVAVEVRPGTATKANDYVPTATVRSIRPVREPADPYEH
ncbi:TIGR03943 family putative permease subunit [Actinophytocola sp.]|uniref:TIGR03943 family putative permease subunit n=1 Tax=Actinophytocola sp. TaxID=1872138 RepID=UPI003D6ADC57